MIANEIAEVKRAKKRLFTKVLISMALLSIVCVVVLIWGSSVNVVTKYPSDQLATGHAELLPHPFDTLPAPSSSTEEKQQQLRTAYLDAFNLYESTLKPKLNKIDLEKWDKPLADKLSLQEQKAIEQFSLGSYANALQATNILIKTSKKAIEDSNKQFEKMMLSARKAFAENDYQSALLAIAAALMHNNISPEAQALSLRIEQLPEISALTEQIRVAKVENNSTSELKLIRKLLVLTPERETLKKRAQSLQTESNDLRFKSLISRAYNAINEGLTAKAKSTLSKARKIYSFRPELNNIADSIQALEQQQRFHRYLKKAQIAESKDDWSLVKKYLELALIEKPNDKLISNKLIVAAHIVTIKHDMAGYLKTPYRLANKVVKTKAEASLIQADTYISQSPSLTNRAKTLQSVLTAVNSPISVEISSDNHTYISVQGVGTVGKTISKIIQLNPGQYTFEGKRDGFKSKIENVLIPYGKPIYRLSIICDERI